MDVNDDARYLKKCVALTFFASKLAPTGETRLRSFYKIAALLRWACFR